MANDEIITLDEESLRKLKRDHDYLELKVRSLEAEREQATSQTKARELYTGITATNASNPTYPEKPANTFVVALTDVFFAESVGTNSPDIKQHSLKVVARTQNGIYVAQGTPVLLERRVSRQGVRWWIVTNPQVTNYAGTTVSSSTAYPDGTADTFEVQLDQWEFTETPGYQGATRTSGDVVIAQTFNGQYVHEGAHVILQKLPAPNGQQWWITEAEHEYDAVTYETIEPDESGEVILWTDGADTGIRIEAWLDWMHGDQAIEENTQVIIRWVAHRHRWRIVQSACEPQSDSPGA